MTGCEALVILRVLIHIVNCSLKGLYKCPLLLSYIFSRDGFVLDLTAEGEGVISVLLSPPLPQAS